MSRLAERVKHVKPSPTLAADAKAKALIKAGEDIINLGAGEPDFPTPKVICDAGVKAIREGVTKYGPAGGLPELKDAIIARFEQRQELIYKAQNILVSVGAKHSLFNLFQATLDPGDEVVIPEPYWVSYPAMIALAGGKTVAVKTDYRNDFIPDPKAIEDAITDRTKMISINSPSNPSGAGYPPEVIQEIARIAIEHDVLICSDEIYRDLVYEGYEPLSPAQISGAAADRTIVVNGVSKTFSMTGWRVGWAAGPAEIIRAMTTIQSQSTSGPAGINQRAALAALGAPQAIVEEMRAAFERRMGLLVAGLRAIEGVECSRPKGAFYVFPYVGAFYGKKTPSGTLISDSLEMQTYLLDEAKVSCVAGAPFGMDGHLRLSFAVSDDDLRKALERLGEALGKLG